MGASKDWEVYERLIAQLTRDQLETNLCVTPNARITRSISYRSRQIDVLIENRHEIERYQRIIIDAKNRSRKIDIADVEAFLGLMQDVRASHGYLVTSSGYTKAAERRAQQAVGLRIVPLDRMDNFDPNTWPVCAGPRCLKGRVFWDGYPDIFLDLVPVGVSPSSPVVRRHFVHYVGKCDNCGLFHVHCLTCGDLFFVPHSDSKHVGHQCSCKLPWFWLASVESDDEKNLFAELHLVNLKEIQTVDRRSLK